MRQVLNEVDAMDRVGDDRKLLAVLIEAFAEEKCLALTEIEAAMTSRDARRLQVATHRLKGGAGTLGAEIAWDFSYAVENRARALVENKPGATWDGMDVAVQNLLNALAQLQPELDRLAAG